MRTELGYPRVAARIYRNLSRILADRLVCATLRVRSRGFREYAGQR